jgi:putative addiction module killer protein
MKIEVEECQDEKGRSLFGVWFDGLDSIAAARIVTSITRMQNGNFSNSKSVGSGVFENKLDFGPGYRIYYAMEGELLIILLAGGTKKRQSKDIREAKVAWINYKKRRKLLRGD